MYSRAFHFIAFICFISSPMIAETVTMTSLLNEMVDRSDRARFPDPAFKLINFSSYNRASVSPDEYTGWFTNNDFNGKYLYDEDVNGDGTDEYVLVDHQSPGAIVRSWMPWRSQTNSNTNVILRVYLDGSDTPVIEGNQFDLFDGTGLIPYPLAHPSLRSAVSFFPIAYAESCKITVSENPFFYIFTCREYPEDAEVESFTMSDYETSASLISSVGSILLDPSSNLPVGTSSSLTQTIAAGAEATLTLPEGGRAVHEFEVAIQSAITPQMLRSIIVKAEFDGLPTIWCPLSDFFGAGVGFHPFEGFYRDVQADGTFTCRWVMPYREAGSITLENLSAASVDLSMTAVTEPWTWDDRSMYFYSAWRSQYPLPTQPRSDWNYVTLTGGRGVFMGDTLTIWNPVTGWWGEGDHKIWVDGEDFPSQFGTGTEDYYGYSWGGRSTDFYEHPFHAQVASHVYDKLNRKTTDERNTYGYSVETRSRGLDGIPFNDRLQLDMEVWHGTDCDMDYAVATHWYAEPSAQSNRTADPDAARRTVWDETNSLSVIDTSLHELDFGFVLNGESSDLVLTVQNRGGGSLVGTASSAAPFSIVSGGSYALATAETQEVVIRFSPTSNGQATGSVSFTGGVGATVQVSGRGFTNAFTPVQTLIADLRADYLATTVGGDTSAFNSGEGLTDTEGSGRWNFFESDATDSADYLDGSTFELLEYAASVGNAGSSGYRDPENSSFAPIIADGKCFTDGIALASDKLAFHPGSESDEASVVARWTAGNGVAGEIRIQGEVGRGSTNLEGGDSRQYYIMKGNAAGTSYSLLTEGSFGAVDTTAVSFDLNTSLEVGEHIDFVVNRVGNYGADEVHLKAQIYAVGDADSDLDELPDLWESQWVSNLLDLTQNGDFDGDGLSDTDEYLSGSNPLDGDDYFELSSYSKTINGFKVTWPTVTGKSYAVERSATLLSDSWTSVAMGQTEGLWLDLSDEAQTADRFFYRVRVE